MSKLQKLLFPSLVISLLLFHFSLRNFSTAMFLPSFLISPGLLSSSWSYPTPAGDQKLGAVATESSVCSQIGIDILREGGNAADAVSLILRPQMA